MHGFVQKKAPPKVSVFMAVYQQHKFVREALESVLAQNYPNMEVIIGDDGSTDGTQDILKEYAQKHPGVITLLLSRENLGITANSNRIFKECRGTYIAFQAGDDIWLPNKITTQVDFMEANPDCSISYHNLEVFDNATGKSSGFFNDPRTNYPYEGGADIVIKYGCFNGAISNMVRRVACPSHGFDTRLPIASDWLFWIETLLPGGKIHYIDRVLGKYRIHSANVSQTTSRSVLLNFADHLNSATILLINYPRYMNDIFFRKAKIYEALSVIDKANYYSYLKISNKLRWNWKNSLRMTAYILSFRRFRK